MPPKSKDGKVTSVRRVIKLRLPADLGARLDGESVESGVPINTIGVRAIAAALSRLPIREKSTNRKP
jgi:hypothetical protein